MPKQTAKWTGALTAARQAGLVPGADQEALYAQLQLQGYWWDSDTKTWDYHPEEEAEPPTALLKLRVHSASETNEFHADDLVDVLTGLGYELATRSKPYVCRPPNQRETMLYLEFIPPKKKGPRPHRGAKG